MSSEQQVQVGLGAKSLLWLKVIVGGIFVILISVMAWGLGWFLGMMKTIIDVIREAFKDGWNNGRES